MTHTSFCSSRVWSHRSAEYKVSHCITTIYWSQLPGAERNSWDNQVVSLGTKGIRFMVLLSQKSIKNEGGKSGQQKHGRDHGVSSTRKDTWDLRPQHAGGSSRRMVNYPGQTQWLSAQHRRTCPSTEGLGQSYMNSQGCGSASYHCRMSALVPKPGFVWSQPLSNALHRSTYLNADPTLPSKCELWPQIITIKIQN